MQGDGRSTEEDPPDLTHRTRLTSTRFMLGINALTSLMTFALFAASIFSSLTVKMVFSLGFSSAASSAAGAAAAADAAGMAISVMLRRVWDVRSAQQGRCNPRHDTCRTQVEPRCVSTRPEAWILELTFSAVTSSETSRRERDEMESTRGAIFGETGDAGGCSGAAEDDGREDEKARREEEGRHDGREAARPSVRSRDRLEVWVGVRYAGRLPGTSGAAAVHAPTWREECYLGGA
jgi:hypothetical protein